MQVTIDTSSREEAELVARLLPRPSEARSIRGYGMVRFRCRNAADRRAMLETVRALAAEHQIPWLRVRWEDEECVIRRGQQLAF
jgi:hypothetical protein